MTKPAVTLVGGCIIKQHKTPPLLHRFPSHSFRHVSDCMIGILTCSSSLSSSLGASRM